MKPTHRSLLIASDGQIERLGDTVYELNFGSTPPELIVAELQLLATGLAQSVTLRHPSTKVKIKISCDEVIGRALTERVVDDLVLRLSETELGFWLTYFLRYYRDGVAEVDHIDIEATSSAVADEVVDIRLRVDPSGANAQLKKFSF